MCGLMGMARASVSSSWMKHVTDIRVGPTGARVGAFFDLDGTLVEGFTAAAHLRYRIRHGQARIGELTGTLEAALRYRFGRMKFEQLLQRAGGYLRGESLAALDEVGEHLFDTYIGSRVYPDMSAVVRAHMEVGHTLALSSSAMTMHASPTARALGIPHVICNRFDVDEQGRLTGAIVRPIIWGARKAEAVTQFCAANDIDLGHSYFYADGEEDLPLMLVVGNPRPVNPRPGLAAAAAEHGWPVLRFNLAGRRFGIGLNT